MSENKDIELGGIHVVELAAYEQPVVSESSQNEWVEYGEDNAYYDWLIARYKNSTTNNSIINNISRLIAGRGLYALNANKKPAEFAQMKALFKNKDLKSVAKNLKMLGNGVFQCVYNKKHTRIVKVTAVKTRHVRPEKCNEDGDIMAYWYSDDWTDVQNFEPQRISRFGTSKDNVEFLVIGEESIDLKYFSEVDYQACLPYCLLEEEVSDYLINDVTNGFSGTKVVNYNNGIPDFQKQQEIASKTKRQLTGSKGDKLIIAFNANSESATTVDDVPLNDAPAHYEYLSKEAQGKILNNHNVVSSYIVGINPEGQGFSSSADEIKTATSFFYNQSIRPHQDVIIEAIDEILAFNGVTLDLYFKNLNLLESTDDVIEEPAEAAFSTQLSSLMDNLGEVQNEDWELIDSRDVDYEREDELDTQLNNESSRLDAPKTALSKLFNFASTGSARPNAKSSQDGQSKGKYFTVRYKYSGSATGQREFCNKMVSSNKIYRKEDILQMGKMAVNAGFGEHGSDTYSIWLFKGGPRCSHKWTRLTFMSDSKTIDARSPKAQTLSRAKARSFGYDVINENKVSIEPRNQPLKGFSPNNKNLPKDV